MRCLHSQFCLDLTSIKCASYLLQTGVRAGAAVRDAAGVPGVPVRDAAGGADAQRARRQPLGARHQDDLRRHPLARHLLPGMAFASRGMAYMMMINFLLGIMAISCHA